MTKQTRKKYEEASSVLYPREHKIRIGLLAADRGVSEAAMLRHVIAEGLKAIDRDGAVSRWKERVGEWEERQEAVREEVRRRHAVRAALRNVQPRSADRLERVVVGEGGEVEAVGLREDVVASVEVSVEVGT